MNNQEIFQALNQVCYYSTLSSCIVARKIEDIKTLYCTHPDNENDSCNLEKCPLVKEKLTSSQEKV